MFALLGLCGLAVAAIGMYHLVSPRTFSPAQRQQIESWEMARRWRTMPKTQIFPAVVHYRLAGRSLNSNGTLELTAHRLAIAQQAKCTKAAEASARVLALLAHDGCQAMLRATYSDASSSLVLTVGIAVLGDLAKATAAADSLSRGQAGDRGAVSDQLVLRPVSVFGTPAGLFGVRQRQLSWVMSSGPYLVLATVGYADGRPNVPVATDPYTYIEMTSFTAGVASTVAAPLGTAPSAPHCPGGPGC